MVNQKGYTMIHALFTFFIFVLIASCIPPLIKGVEMVDRKLEPSKKYEWDLFSHQFRQELKGAEEIKVMDTSISFLKGDEKIVVEVYGEFLRRRVDGRGHEIILGPFRNIQFSPCTRGVEINAGFQENLQVTGRFFTYGSW